MRHKLTVVAGQAPSRGHTLHAAGEDITALGHTHGGHTHAQLGRAGQLDQQDVVVGGVLVVAGVLEDLSLKRQIQHSCVNVLSSVV